MMVKGSFCPVIKANSPFSLVVEPLVVPLMDTLAPTNNSLVVEFKTLPDTVALMVGGICATETIGNSNAQILKIVLIFFVITFISLNIVCRWYR